MVVFSERGGRGGVAETGDGSGGDRNSVMKQYIMGSAQTNARGEGHHPAVFDFSVRAQRGMVDAKSDDTGGPALPPLKISSSDQIGSEDVIISPPQSSFWQRRWQWELFRTKVWDGTRDVHVLFQPQYRGRWRFAKP